MEKNFFDNWAMETGNHSAYLTTYAHRQHLAEEMNALIGTSTDHNLANNFCEYERMTATILKMQFCDMLVNLITYKNVPETFNTAQLELMLRGYGGGVCVGKDEIGDIVVLSRTEELGYNAYYQAIPSFLDDHIMTNKKIITNRNLNGDYVVFYNKLSNIDFYSNDFAIVDHYTKMLATIDATERLNILQMRAPYILKGTKNGVNSGILEAAYMKGDLFMEVDQDADFANSLSKMDLNVQDRTSTLQTSYRNTLNKMLTIFGVYNNPELKKERQTAGETTANNHIVEAMGDIYLNARRHAVDLLNRAFNLDIRVEWNSSVATAFRNFAEKRP